MKNVIIVMILAAIISCTNEVEKKTEAKAWAHEVTVEEVVQTSAYTYLLVDEGGVDSWIAVAKMNANVNDVLYYNSGLEMPNFKSKELDRTFEKLLLVQVISDGKNAMQKRTAPSTQGKIETHGTETPTHVHENSIGAISLTQLFTNPTEYGGKTITVSGKVVKFAPSIMGRNWIHIVDNESEYDLTITTNAVVKIDSEVTFIGVIALDKDFGAGYKYAIIMEDSALQ
ncbi:MAG: hypothetical protein QM503_05185 [Bacteroidota bacterium]